jgi:hypothetical protein
VVTIIGNGNQQLDFADYEALVIPKLYAGTNTRQDDRIPRITSKGEINFPADGCDLL